MITGNPLDLHFPDVFFEMAGLVPGGRMMLKLEGFNITGSIKLKSALFMVEHLERSGLLVPGRSTVVESSSGNLGVAVALICRMRGYGFVCVTDPNVSAVNLRAIRAYGGRIDRVDTKDEQGGYLRTRLDRVAQLLTEDPDRVWLNQYANPANARAHAQWTARQILQSVPDVTHLYVGTGTTGTMMGLAESFARLSPQTELVAVEPEGSVTFGAARPGRRRLPGLGTSSPPAIADAGRVHRIVHVAERDAVRRCHRTLESHGLLVGSSTGYVLEAVVADADGFAPDSVVVGVSPDFGDKYLDTLYDTEWLEANFEDAAEAFPSVGEDVGPRAPLCGPLSEILNHPQGDGEAPAPLSPLTQPTH